MRSKIFSMLVTVISFYVLIFHQCTKENTDYNKSSTSYSLKIGNEYDQDLIPFLTKEGLYGYFSRTLNKLVIPAYYKEAGFFRNGFAAAKMEEGDKVSICCDFEYDVQLPTADSIINKKQIDSLKKHDIIERKVLLKNRVSKDYDELVSKVDIGQNDDRNLYFYPNIEMLVLEVGNSFYIKSKDSTEFSKQRYTSVGDFIDELSLTTIVNITTGEKGFIFLEADGRKPILHFNSDGQQFYHVTGRTYLSYHKNYLPFIIEYDGWLLKKVSFDRLMSFEDAYNLALAENYFVQYIDLPEKWEIKELVYLGANCWAFSSSMSIYKIFYMSRMKTKINLINLMTPFNEPKLSLSGGVTLMQEIGKGKLIFCSRKESTPQFIYYKTMKVIQSHRCLCVNEVSAEKGSHFYIDEFGLVYSESRIQIPLTKANGVKLNVDFDDKGIVHYYKFNARTDCRSYEYKEDTMNNGDDDNEKEITGTCTVL